MTHKILIFGGSGKFGSYLANFLSSIKDIIVVTTNHADVFSISNNQINCDLHSIDHLKKIFDQYSDYGIIDLCVTRNPMPISEIRDVETFLKDIEYVTNYAKFIKNNKFLIYMSTASVYSDNIETNTDAKQLANDIVNFINNLKPFDLKVLSDPLISGELLFETPSPYRHPNLNLRMNGCTKLLSEAILKIVSKEKNIPLLVLRSSRIIYKL